MNIKNIFFSLILLFAFSCTDGTQIGQHINQLVDENEIEIIAVNMESKNGKFQTKEYPVIENMIENQFLLVDGEFINIGRIKRMKISGKKLEIKL